MNLRPIPLFGIGNQGKSVNVDAQSRINLYVEVQQDVEKNVLTLYPTPGIASFVNFGANKVRGFYKKDSLLYAVNTNKFYSIAVNGTITNLGTLSTTVGTVDITDNGTQIMLVDGPNGYIYNTSTLAFTKITSPGFPGGDTVTFFNGRFVVNKPDSAQFYISSLYDGLTWDALDFATAESDPDKIIRVVAEGGQLVLFGERTTEFWGDSGAQDFPYARIGSAAIEWGLAARWSLAKFMDSLIFLRRNRLGQVQVAVQSGSSSQSVGNPEIDYQLGQYQETSDATGFAYMFSGHPFYQINFPTENKSWLYDGHSKSWSKLQFGVSNRHRADMLQILLNKIYVTDYEDGRIYTLQDGTYTDDGQAIVREFTSRNQANGNWRALNQLWLELESGVGLQTGQGTDPQLMMQISRDGGHEWGPEVWRPIGAAGKYKTRAVFNRLGQARDWLFRFRITDAVKTVFIAAWGR